jgi:hypothetical protein
MPEPKEGKLTGLIPAARFNYRRALPYCVRVERESITLLNRDYLAIVTRHCDGRIEKGGKPHGGNYYIYCDNDIPSIEALEAVYLDILRNDGVFAKWQAAFPTISRPPPFADVEKPDWSWLTRANGSGRWADRRVVH